MQRLLTTAILGGLLVATAAAFAVTERLKLTKSPIFGTVVYPKTGFSPTCGCAKGKATVRIKLRRADDVTVGILDSHNAPVRTLVDGVQASRGANVFRWDGRTDGNALAKAPLLMHKRQPLLRRLRKATDAQTVLAVSNHGAVRQHRSRVRRSMVVSSQDDIVALARSEA